MLKGKRIIVYKGNDPGAQARSEAKRAGFEPCSRRLRNISRSHSLFAIIALCVSVSSTTVHAGQLLPLDQPRAAPELSLPDISDRIHDLTDYRGQVVLVNFWASWCPPCIYEMPGLQRLADQLETRPFALLTVNVGEAKHRVRRFLKLTRFTETVVLDKRAEAFGRWGASVYPTSYLIDRAGRIRFEATGPLEWDSEEVLASIEALLAETHEQPPKMVKGRVSLSAPRSASAHTK